MAAANHTHLLGLPDNIKVIERRGEKLRIAIVRINAQVAQLSGAVGTRCQ